MNEVLWILIADAYQAKFYRTEKLNSDDWSLVKEFTNPEAREHDIDLVSDKPGRYRNAQGPISAMDEPTDPKQVEIDNFARTLAQELNEGRTHQSYAKLIIVSPPRFYGMLQKHCNSQTKALVIKHLEKDYVHISEHEMLTMVRKQLKNRN